MEVSSYNHYINYSILEDKEFLEKDRLILWKQSKIQQQELEKSGSDRLGIKRRSKYSGLLSDGQFQGYKFENEIWKWLTKLKPHIINHPGYDLNLDLSGYKIESNVTKPYQDSKQTDVFAMYSNHAFVVECKATANSTKFSSLKKELALLRALIPHKNKRLEKLFGQTVIPVHIVALKGFDISEEEKSEELSHPDGSIIILTERERKYIDVVLESSESEEFALNQFLGFFRAGRPDFNKWVLNENTGNYSRKKFKVAAFSSNSGTGRKKNVFTFSIEPRDMLKITTVSHQKAKNIFEFERSSNKYYQRLLTGRRLKEIGSHLKNKKTPFPNNILVSYRGKSNLVFEPDPIDESTNSGRRPGKLVFDGCPGTFHVIDGQHRLFGYMAVDASEGGIRDKHRLIVTAFSDLDVDDEAEIFLEVNENSQKVKSDLIMEIEYAGGKESLSNLCNGVIFNLRDNKNSVLCDRIAPAEEKRKKGFQPWDLKPTNLKNVLMKFSLTGKEDYQRGIFWEKDYNKTAENIFLHINSMLNVIKERSGYWHNNIPARHSDKAWYSEDMKKNSKGFLQNNIAKGLFKLFDRITMWNYRKYNITNEELTARCTAMMQEITQNFNKLSVKERYKYFDVKRNYGQGEQGIDKVSSLFLINFLDQKNYEGLITDTDRDRVSDSGRASQRELEEALTKIDELEHQIAELKGPSEKQVLLEGEFRRGIHAVFVKLFGKSYWTDVFFAEKDLRQYVAVAKDRINDQKTVLSGDPNPEVGFHDEEIEYLEWTHWINIIAELIKKKDYYQKEYLNKTLNEDLESIIRRVFYVDDIAPIKNCNYKQGTNWMKTYNELRRLKAHHGSAKLTPTQIKTLENLEPKVTEKIRLMTTFSMR